MQFLLTYIDEHLIGILISFGGFFAFLFLVRSFRRNLLIERGQARFVLERYDVGTEKLHRWVTYFILFLLLPLIAYVKFLNQ